MYWLLGDIHYYQDHQDSARHYYLKGIEQHSIEGDSSSLAELYVSMAWTYYEGNLLDSVGLYSLLAMDIARKVGYTQRWLETNRLMGDLFYYVNDYTHAMIYFRQGIDSIPLTDTLNEFELTELAGIYASMSSTLAELGELKEARIWNDRSDSIVSILQDSFHLIWNLYGHGYLDIYEGNYSSGIQKCKEAVTYFASSEEPSLISGCLECVGRGFLLMGEPDSAIVYLLQALEENTTENEFSFYSDVHELLSQAYEEVGDMSKSLFHQKRFKFYADSLQDIAQKSNVVLLQTEFQFRKVQAEKAQLEAISRRDEAIIKGQRTANLLITLALVLTGLLAGVLSYTLRINKHRNERLEAEVTRRTAELEASNNSLLQANAELEEFAHISSHDLKEPIRNISSFSSLIRKRGTGISSEDLDEFVSIIEFNAKQMQQLVSDIYDFTKINKKELEFSQVSTYSVLDDIVKLLSSMIKESNCRIDAEFDVDNIQSNRGMLFVVLRNLIENAIKYNDKPEPIVKVRMQESDTEYIWSVSDNGIGIESRYHDRIFGLFKRLHNRETFQGSGLGLAIVKKIVNRFGGNI
jgi:signal transduction histidine kinase